VNCGTFSRLSFTRSGKFAGTVRGTKMRFCPLPATGNLAASPALHLLSLKASPARMTLPVATEFATVGKLSFSDKPLQASGLGQEKK
jgi:hypothetical protein